jgi:hypothetical protein
VLSVPLLVFKQDAPYLAMLFRLGILLLLSLFALTFFYWTTLYHQSRSFWQATRRLFPDFFLFLAMSMGMSLHNSLAVVEGYMGRKTPFIRTPKHNLIQAKDSWKQHAYTITSIHPLTLAEGLLAAYFVYGIFLALQFRDYGLLPFHLMLAIGFGAVFFYTLFHSKRAS